MHLLRVVQVTHPSVWICSAASIGIQMKVRLFVALSMHQYLHNLRVVVWGRGMVWRRRLELSLAKDSSERSNEYSWRWIWQCLLWVWLCFVYHIYFFWSSSQIRIRGIIFAFYCIFQGTHLRFPCLPGIVSIGQNTQFASGWTRGQGMYLGRWCI